MHFNKSTIKTVCLPGILPFFFLFAFFVTTIGAQELTLDDIFLSGNYRQHSGGQIRFQHTSSDFTRLEEDENGFQNLILYDVKNDEKVQTLLNTGDLNESIQIAHYDFSEDDKMILLATEEESIFRYSRQAFYYVYDLDKKTLVPLSSGGKQMYPHFSPDNSKVGFIRDNDVYYKDLINGAEVRVSHDGLTNHIINGRSDWVYEEEFMLTRAFEWKADGTGLIYLRFDESEVPEFSYMRYDGAYPYTESFKYPRVGEVNSKVTLHHFNTKEGIGKKLEIPFEYEYIPRLIAADEGYAFLLMNRHQNHLRLMYHEPESGKFTTIYEETDERYIELPNVFVNIEEGQYIINSERDGFTHMYLVSEDKIEPVTYGEFEVKNYYGIDKDNWVYYQSTEKSPIERHVYKTQLKTGKKVLLTTGAGTHRASFAGNFDYFIHRHSADADPLTVSVKDKLGNTVRMIEDNSAVRERIDAFFSPKQFQTIPINGEDLYTYVIYPPDFDTLKQYPVLMYTYGGPGGQRSVNDYGGYLDLWFQMLAQNGYIIVCADNRGTEGRGAEFKKIHYLNMGKYALEDQLALAKYFGAKPYVDESRIGFYGWSYGGYLGLLGLFKGAGTFKAVLSVAPISDWRFYDTIYTERYMRTPEENPQGYEDLAPVNAVAEWESGKLFLAHGTADDNVHFQNTTELIKSMNSMGKHYDVYFYPDGDHGMGSFWNFFHLFQKMTNFILEEL